MTDKAIVNAIEVRLGLLNSYKNGLKFDPVDPTIPMDRKVVMQEEANKAQIRIDELERLKKIIYTS